MQHIDVDATNTVGVESAVWIADCRFDEKVAIHTETHRTTLDGKNIRV